MLRILLNDGRAPRPVTVSAGWRLPEGAIWLDLLDPTREEELAAEEALGLSLPTREEMAEIESSSRLYREDGAIFIRDHTSAPLAQLRFAGPGRFEGQSTGGQPVQLVR